MSPRQNVVVENSALKRFMKKHGYCIGAAWLAGLLDAELMDQPEPEEGTQQICCAGLRVLIKRRNDQWFVTDIEKAEE